jgi:hypothetical protein
MGHMEGAARVQHLRCPEALADDRTDAHVARCIAAVVDSLDLETRGLQRPEPAPTGRPSSAPGD